MVSFLYYAFLYQQQIGNAELSFSRIKRLLSNSVSDFQGAGINISAFYKLLRLGLIDVSETGKYKLSQTNILSNSKTNFSLGINLPDLFIEKNREYLKESFLGFTIFSNLPCDPNNFDYEKIDFDFVMYTRNFQNINQIVKNWINIKGEDIGNYKSIEKYDFEYNKWISSDKIDGDYALFKKYDINDFYYSYLFKFGNNYYEIKINELEKVRMIILSKSKPQLIKYKKDSNEITLNNYYNYPYFLYKTFLISHILSNGTFPKENSYKMDLKDFVYIMKKLKLNYEIL